MTARVIKNLESDNSKLFKADVILKEAINDNSEFFQGCRMALNCLHTFGIKQVPSTNSDGTGLSWDDFVILADKLNKRELTGNDAKYAVKEASELATVDQWNNWYRRILIKDIRCGVSEKTINKMVKQANKPQYEIPVFDCMLAHDSAKHEKKMVGEKYLDTKLDGVRAIAILNKDNNSVTIYSRNGKILENFKHIEDEILSLSDQFNESMVLDGEVVSETFQDLMRQVHRKSNVNASDARLALFDMLPLKEFQAGKSKLGLTQRNNQLKELGKSLSENGSVFILEKIKVNLNTQDGQTEYKKLNKMAIDKGYEGIMIKDVDALYECKRSSYMLKAKPFIEVSLDIVQLEEGTGKNEGKLGAFVCEGVDDGKDIKVNVGSGLTDAQREEYWNNQNKLIGMVIEVRADAITQNQDGTYSLRFPRFLRFRGFEKGEKI